ncbi:MAG TPA: hypothetical protein VK636_15415 [Gemmatimonadaceae bacterium]|nr:hypothetical protein [Gemmatimonadaceae bacterium]
MRSASLRMLLCLMSIHRLAAQTPVIPFKPSVLIPGYATSLGEVVGIAAVGSNTLFVYARGSSIAGEAVQPGAQLLTFDAASLKLQNTVHPPIVSRSLAQAIRADRDENIWVVDAGANVVMKLTSAGSVRMILGHRPFSPIAPNNQNPSHEEFRRPSDVAFDATKRIYVADALNHRIEIFESNGRWVKEIATKGTGKPLTSPLSIAIDAKDRLFVAESGSDSIQIYNADWTFFKAVKMPPSSQKPSTEKFVDDPESADLVGVVGGPHALCISPGPDGVLFAADVNPGRIVEFSIKDDISVVGELGGRGKGDNEFGWVHAIACRAPDLLFVADLLNWRAEKLVLSPPTPPGRGR